MIDLHLNDDMDLSLSGGNDLKTIKGIEDFKQQIATHLQIYFVGAVGKYNTDELVALIRMRVREVAVEYNRISFVDSVNVKKSDEIPNTIEINISYVTGETFQVMI